jgi:hypothetical protein
MPRNDRSQSASSSSQASNGNRPLSDKQKLEEILQLLSNFRWTLSTLLLVLFRSQKRGVNGQPLPVERSVLHQRMLTAMLDGTTSTHFGEILELVYQNAQQTSYRRDDDTIPSRGLFSTIHSVSEIKHSQPAMVTWAVQLISALVADESSAMVDKDTGLHLRAQAKKGSRSWDYRATWDAIDAFSMRKLQDTSQAHAPIIRDNSLTMVRTFGRSDDKRMQ